MFDVFLDIVKKIIKSRLFPITLIYFALFFFIVNRLFVLQIVQGPAHASDFDLKYTKPREIKATRGNIYDRNGKLLATNTLSYSVTLEDNSKVESNDQRNEVIHQLIDIIEKNGDTLDNEFFIKQNEDGKLEFTVEGKALTRFKMNAYAYMLDDKGQLTEEEKAATAQEVYDFLKHGTGNDYTTMFGISDDYSVADALKIMGVRYALFCNYPKYLTITVASRVTDTTVAAIKEASADLPGVEIQQQTQRVYNDSLYFAHILGYTGLISQDELDDYNKDSKYYNSTDVVGKYGLEKEYEKYLGGTKGNEVVTVNSSNKVIDVVDRKDPVAGNDVYLTIDSDLQKATYHILEKEIAGILISRIKPDMDYGSKGESAAEINVPIYEVYFALLNNNIIDINKFKDSKDKKSLEYRVYQKYQTRLSTVFNQLDHLLSVNNTITNKQAGDMEDYLDNFYTVLVKNNILLEKSIPDDDATYKDYQNDKIPLSSFLQYAIANNWVDLTKLKIGTAYYSADELYSKLIAYTKNLLESDSTFNKKIYRNLVFSYNLSGSEICLLLFDQDVLKYNEDEVNGLKNGSISPYNFIIDKMTSLEITPAMLALEPCSGSVVITDVNTGDVLALVTYPSYDNNKLANKIDSAYYTQLLNDKSLPLMNRPIQQRTAPGSTFKMVTSFAALTERVVTPSETIYDKALFDKINPAAKCNSYPNSHGTVNLADALKVSCNYFFYEMGWRLSIDSTGKYNPQLGLKRLSKYATMFGLNTASGIELPETSPQISNDDAVRSAIGQGSNVYTPAQLAKYITTLANGGTNYKLTLLDDIKDKDGKVILNNSPIIENDLTKIAKSTWDTVHDGMWRVVNAPGGSVEPIYKNLGVTVAGKTGTSQISKVDPNNALFVSYAPYDKPEISVTAVIPNGYTSHNAGALVKDIYSYYYKLQNTDDLVGSNVEVPTTQIDAAAE